MNRVNNYMITFEKVVKWTWMGKVLEMKEMKFLWVKGVNSLADGQQDLSSQTPMNK